jgi:nucleoside-diphosphate-sugar epimerase
MKPLSVLLLGGTGVISSAVAERAVEVGHDVHLLTRSRSDVRPAPDAATLHFADVRDAAAVDRALGELRFDVVVDFVAFETSHVRADIDRFAGKVGQYIFISTTSAYQKPALHLPITESTPLRNPYLSYSRAKIDCEDLVVAAYRERDFPATIVRPSFTYDRTTFPLGDGWTLVDRMRRGLPVIVHGDGSALCTLTHNTDFARTLVALFGHPQSIGDSFHITSDEILTWHQAYDAIATAAGVDKPSYVYVPSVAIEAADPSWGDVLLGDKTHSAFFDNTKVRALVPEHRALVPYWQGARETVAWYDAHPEAQVSDPARVAVMDRLAEQYRL